MSRCVTSRHRCNVTSSRWAQCDWSCLAEVYRGRRLSRKQLVTFRQLWRHFHLSQLQTDSDHLRVVSVASVRLCSAAWDLCSSRLHSFVVSAHCNWTTVNLESEYLKCFHGWLSTALTLRVQLTEFHKLIHLPCNNDIFLKSVHLCQFVGVVGDAAVLEVLCRAMTTLPDDCHLSCSEKRAAAISQSTDELIERQLVANYFDHPLILSVCFLLRPAPQLWPFTAFCFYFCFCWQKRKLKMSSLQKTVISHISVISETKPSIN